MGRTAMVTVMLQHESVSFVESREIFDHFLTDFPDFSHYISDDALIVENEDFEKAVMRLARGLPLTDAEVALVEPLLKEDCPPAPTVALDNPPLAEAGSGASVDDTEASYSDSLQRKLKRQRLEQQEAEKAKTYVDLHVLPGTSVNCERLFSAAKFILSDTRKRTSPKLFEALLLLKVNKCYWNAVSVGKAMGRTVDSVGNAVDEDDILDSQDDCRA